MSIGSSTEKKILLFVHFQDADTSGVRAVIRPSQALKMFIAASMAISIDLCDGKDGDIALVKPIVSNHLRFLMFVSRMYDPCAKRIGLQPYDSKLSDPYLY